MCMSLPGKVFALNGALALVEVTGRQLWCNALAQPEVTVGDYVLVHANLIVAIISKLEAEQMFQTARELDEALRAREVQFARAQHQATTSRHFDPRIGYGFAGLNAVISGFAIYINSLGAKLFGSAALYTTLKNAVVGIALLLPLLLFAKRRRLMSATEKYIQLANQTL